YRRQLRRARELLGDGAAALDNAPGAEVPDRSGEDAHRIDAEVLIEAPVLDRNDGVHHVRRDAIERHRDALLDEVAESRLAMAIEDDRRPWPGRDAAQRARAVQLTGDRCCEGDRAPGSDPPDHCQRYYRSCQPPPSHP